MKKLQNFTSIILVALLLLTAVESSNAQIPMMLNVTPSVSGGVITVANQINTTGYSSFIYTIKWTTDLTTVWNPNTVCDSFSVVCNTLGININYYYISTPALPTGKYSLQTLARINGVGNSQSTCQVTVMTTGVLENAHQQISVFPNPATDFVKIGKTDFSSSVEIFNSFGSLVYKGPAGEIKISDFTPGIYSFILSEGDKVKSGRFLKN